VLRETVRLVLFCLLILSANPNYAQTVTNISGTITDEEGLPLPAVTVFIHEVSKSTQTNNLGEFNISGIKPGNYHLHLHLIGYKAAEIDLVVSAVNQPLKIKLQQASIELNNITIEESILKSGQREQSQSMQVVDKEFMLKNGNASLVKILENIPGVSSINTGQGVSKPVIRGMGFNRVVVAENGIKQEGQQWGGDHGLEIDQFAVDRVEVLKGPSSLMYGSDGIGGVVNIRPAPAPELNTTQSALLLTGRSVNDFVGLSGMTSINKNDKFFRARISVQDYADYRVPADSFIYNSYILPIENQRLKNTAGRERNAQIMMGTSKKWGFSTLTFSVFDQKVGLFSGAHGIPRSYQLKHDSTHRDIDLPYQRVQHYKALSNTSLMIGKHWMEIDLGYQYNHRREFSFPHAHGKGPQPQGDVELGVQAANPHIERALPLRRTARQFQLGVRNQQQRAAKPHRWLQFPHSGVQQFLLGCLRVYAERNLQEADFQCRHPLRLREHPCRPLHARCVRRFSNDFRLRTSESEHQPEPSTMPLEALVFSWFPA
jgi:iron complex outermembrane recepter protein